jgi:hypothetical protein
MNKILPTNSGIHLALSHEADTNIKVQNKKYFRDGQYL